MAFSDDLIQTGVHPEVAQVLGASTVRRSPTRDVATALTATGSALSDAYQITTLNSTFGTVASSTGAKLPSYWPIGQLGFVQNDGANPLTIYPPTSSGTINGGSAGAGVTVAAAAGSLIVRRSTTDFSVYVLAKEA